MDIEIKGDIIEDDSQWLYDWIGWTYTSAKNISSQLKQANGQPIKVKVNSPGGSVFAASEIYTELRNYPGDVKIEIVGLAASAASVISMAGKSIMSPTAQIMVHNVSTGGVRGDYRVMEHTAEVLKNANDTIANAYMAKSGMSREKALELMNNETWLSAEKAKELGLIDEIMFEENNKSPLRGLSNFKTKGLYNSFSSIPEELIEKLIQANGDQPILVPKQKDHKVDFLMQQNIEKEKIKIMMLRGE
ncbi:head maturation protease, ClpP-related [Romboutsia sp.]|uniref:head maturation protease, ClpP-related n=1 Tax=Romboutsia sp. TaxID=1965302 RepID=UPI002D0BDD03|nr:head maturation protease, ClpP-related [Romboutsia sp.]HSQ88092.1 head maturation protease, ClpP-related [Romboutsia sp.]